MHAHRQTHFLRLCSNVVGRLSYGWTLVNCPSCPQDDSPKRCYAEGMNTIGSAELEKLRSIVPIGAVIEFKDEGATPDGSPLGRLVLRSSGLPVFSDGRWATLPEAGHIARYFGVELFES